MRKHELEALEKGKQALAQQVTLTHRDYNKMLCVFTDAYDHIWSGIIIQVPFVDTALPVEQQRHSPLGFLSYKFDKTQMRWATVVTESSAIIFPLQRMHCML